MSARMLRMTYTIKGFTRVTVSNPDDGYSVNNAIEQLTRCISNSNNRIDPESVRFEWEGEDE